MPKFEINPDWVSSTISLKSGNGMVHFELKRATQQQLARLFALNHPAVKQVTDKKPHTDGK